MTVCDPLGQNNHVQRCLQQTRTYLLLVILASHVTNHRKLPLPSFSSPLSFFLSFFGFSSSFFQFSLHFCCFPSSSSSSSFVHLPPPLLPIFLPLPRQKEIIISELFRRSFLKMRKLNCGGIKSILT